MRLTEHTDLKARLLYVPQTGIFYWIDPPIKHPELLGEEAGYESADSSGKRYYLIQINGFKYRRARLAFLYMTGFWPSEMVDHINGDSTDDRWVNLRDVSVSQNNQNRKIGRLNRKFPMGVRQSRSGRYEARIGVNGTQLHIGTFDHVEQALDAYQTARGKYYGEFA